MEGDVKVVDCYWGDWRRAALEERVVISDLVVYKSKDGGKGREAKSRKL